MKSQDENVEFGMLVEMYSKNKANTKLGSIYIGYVSELKLHRTERTDPSKPAIQYLKQQYPIEDPYSSQRHDYHNASTVFEVFKAAGCNVNYLSDQQIQQKNNCKQYERIEQLQKLAQQNKKAFLEKYQIEETISDCYTIYYEDVGAQLSQILIFRDSKYWYRVDTEKYWPGYEY